MDILLINQNYDQALITFKAFITNRTFRSVISLVQKHMTNTASPTLFGISSSSFSSSWIVR